MAVRLRRCVLALVTMVLACAAEVEAPKPAPDGGAGGGGSNGGLPPFDGGHDAPGVSAMVGDAACAMQTVKSEKLPLDLYLMLDTSLSMLEDTSSKRSKWDEVKDAIGAFIAEPDTKDLGLGLQYFPLVRKDVPADCLSDRGCGMAGPCKRARTCSPGAGLHLCDTQDDCNAGQSCVLLGGCTQSIDFCTNIGLMCPGTNAANVCELITGYCRGRDHCETELYAAPEVPIAPLPNVAGQIVPSLAARTPDGLTPTAPALAGAIQYLQAHLKANPGRRAAVVLATDGFPVECTPFDIPGIAAMAKAAATATPAVPTFVIGVFAPLEAGVASRNLDALADAGGTGKAFVISTGKNVNDDFLAALNAISHATLACEYKIPAARMGEPIDFNKVNVQFTAGDGQVSLIGNVAGKDACDPVRGGWYYDVNPGGGGKPTKIVACDATCDAFRMDSAGRADSAARVDLVLGCQTTFFE